MAIQAIQWEDQSLLVDHCIYGDDLPMGHIWCPEHQGKTVQEQVVIVYSESIARG